MKHATAIHLVQIKDLPEGSLLGVEIEGTNLLITRYHDEFSVFEGNCPHQGTMLAEGSLENGHIVCPAHQWRFDCTSGKKYKSAQTCLKKFDVIIENDAIAIDADQFTAWKQESKKPHVQDTHDHIKLIEISDLPGPAGLPIVGNLLDVKPKKMHQQLEAWAKAYGPIFKLKLAKRTIVVIANPPTLNTILKERPKTFRRMPKMELIAEEMGVNGVFTAEGASWKRQRHFAMQGLANKHLRQFFPTLQEVTSRLHKRWKKAAEEEKSTEVQQDLMRFTVDVTTSLAFGHDMNTLEQSQNTIQQHLDHIFPMIQRRLFIPIPYWKYFKLPVDRKLDHALVEIKKSINGFILQAKEKITSTPDLKENPTNFLEALLTAQGEDGSHFSDEEIFANVFTMLLAGEDTTANTLAWVMHYMAEMPEMQKKMQAEADAALGNDLFLSDMNQAKQLPYIEAVANEAMRLKPVVPTMYMSTNEDTELDNVVIPKGTPIILLTRVGVMDHANFKMPKDFIPERWLAPTDDSKHIHQQTFIPFGSGPRLCPGRSLALLEIKTAVAMICRNFTVTKPSTHRQVEEHLSFTMGPNNLFINFEQRKH